VKGQVVKTAKHLSGREKQVLKLLGEGKSLRQIGKLLKLSESSAYEYGERLKRKLGAANMHQLIRLAVLSVPRLVPRVYDVTQTLTSRERQVVDLIGEGKRAVEIAKQLRLSPKTIYEFCTRAKSKLRAANFHQFICIAVLWREGALRLRKTNEWRYNLRGPSAR
jgi:DNA-binding CsgD family transcriptional regulator